MADIPYGKAPEGEPFATVLPEARDLRNYEDITAASDKDAFGASVAEAHEHVAQQQMFAANVVGESDRLLAEGMQRLGAGATDASKFMGQVAADSATNDTVKKANALLYGDPTKKNPDGSPDTGFYGLRGKEAAAAAPGIQAQLDELISEAHDNLATPMQQYQFDVDTRRWRQQAQREIGAFMDRQNIEWGTKEADAGISNAVNNYAAYATDPRWEPVYDRELQLAIAKKTRLAGGTPGDSTDPVNIAGEYTYKQTKARLQLQARLALDPVDAQRYLEQPEVKVALGDEYYKYSAEIKPKADLQIGLRTAQRQFDILNGTAPAAVAGSTTNGSAELSPGFEDRLTTGGTYKGVRYGGESGGQWNPTPTPNTDKDGNTYYVYGKFQMGPGEIKTYAPPGTTIQQFRDSPEIQTQAFHAYQADHIRDIHRLGLDQYIGQDYNGVPITMDGLVAGAHLGGIGGLQRFLSDPKHHNPSDNLGTSIGSYVERYSAWTRPGTSAAGQDWASPSAINPTLTGEAGLQADVAAEGAPARSGAPNASVSGRLHPDGFDTSDDQNPKPDIRPTLADGMRNIQNDPALTIQQKMIAQSHLREMINNRDTNQQKQDNADVRGIENQLNNLQTILSSGHPIDPDKIPEVTNLDDIADRSPMLTLRVRAAQDLRDAIAYGNDAMGRMINATPIQMEQIRDEVAASPATTPAAMADQNKMIDALDRARVAIMKARTENAAGFEFKQNPALGVRFGTEFQASLKAGQPTSGLSRVFDETLAAEDTHGASPMTRALLPVQVAQSLSLQVMSGSVRLTALKQALGSPYYSQVLADLERRGGLDPEMVEAERFPDAMRDGIRQSVLDKDSNTKLMAMFKSLPNESNPVTIANRVIETSANNGDLSRFLDYMQRSGADTQQREAIQNAITRAAGSEILSGRSTDAGLNALKAYLGQFQELNVNSSGHNPWVPKQISDTVSKVIAQKMETLSPPPRFKLGSPQADLYQNSVRYNGEWVALRDAAGLQLVMPNNKPVIDYQTNLPVTVMFNEQPKPAQSYNQHYHIIPDSHGEQ